VLATGDTTRVFNGFCGAESGFVPVSTVAPAALVGEIELQRVARAMERGPILPPPWQGSTATPTSSQTPNPTSNPNPNPNPTSTAKSEHR
jgi:hypothetical protein